MSRALYLETSAVLRATLESGTTPELEKRISAAGALLTSRLALVECARALLRVRRLFEVPEPRLAEVERQVELLWGRCEIWELTPSVCDLACRVAPQSNLRTLDALHLATYLLARRRIEALELLTADKRLAEAAGAG